LLKAASYMTNRRKLFWQIPVLLILGLTALELWYPGSVVSLPVLREVRVHWCAMRLKSDDPEIQASAARVLGDMGPKAKRAVPALIEALDSSRSEVRDAAARALGNIGPDAEAAVESLIRIQKTERKFLTVEKALGQIGEPGLEPFITGLQDKNASVREHAAEALAHILANVAEPKLAQKAIQPLINALQDEDLRVRSAAAMAIHGIVHANKDPDIRATAAQALICAMKDIGVRPSASGALREIGEPAFEPLIGALEDKDVRMRSAAAMAMQHVLPAVKDPETRARAVEPLIRAMKDEVGPFTYAPGALGKIGEPAFEPLIAALQDKDVRMRRAAAMAMQHVLPAVKDPEIRARAVEPLVRALRDTDHEVHVYAAVALGEIGPDASEAIPALVEAFKDKDVSGTAAEALAKIGPKAIPALIRAARDEDTRVRGCAIMTLGDIGPDAGEAVPVLIDALKSGDDLICVAAALSLGQLGPSAKKAIPTLVQALEGDDRHVRVHVADALRRLGWQAREKLLPMLIEALKDEDACRCAATALSEFGSEASEAVPALIEAAKDNDLKPVARHAATEALKKIDPDAATEAGLKSITRDSGDH